MDYLYQKYYITGTRRGLGKYISEKLNTCDNLDDCDVFINCKHDGFSQVHLLYEAARKNKKIINIGSVASDWTKGHKGIYIYGIEKKALKDANDQLYYQGINTTIINFGYFDSERSAEIKEKKLSLDYCFNVIEWVLQQPHRVKEISVCV